MFSHTKGSHLFYFPMENKGEALNIHHINQPLQCQESQYLSQLSNEKDQYLRDKVRQVRHLCLCQGN